MFNNLIASNFNNLSDPKFVGQVQQIIDAMTGNTAFPEPWPATVPSLAQIQTDLAAYLSVLTATAGGDKSRIVERQGARSKVQNDLALLAFQLQLTAQGDATLLASTGFPLRQRAPRTQNPEPPPPPAVIKLSRGAVSGTLVVSASRVVKAGSYDVQLTAADPTVEANWTDAGVYKTCRRIELEGLTPMKVYSVRMRALGTAGYGAWSVATSVVVL